MDILKSTVYQPYFRSMSSYIGSEWQDSSRDRGTCFFLLTGADLSSLRCQGILA